MLSFDEMLRRPPLAPGAAGGAHRARAAGDRGRGRLRREDALLRLPRGAAALLARHERALRRPGQGRGRRERPPTPTTVEALDSLARASVHSAQDDACGATAPCSKALVAKYPLEERTKASLRLVDEYLRLTVEQFFRKAVVEMDPMPRTGVYIELRKELMDLVLARGELPPGAPAALGAQPHRRQRGVHPPDRLLEEVLHEHPLPAGAPGRRRRKLGGGALRRSPPAGRWPSPPRSAFFAQTTLPPGEPQLLPHRWWSATCSRTASRRALRRIFSKLRRQATSTIAPPASSTR